MLHRYPVIMITGEDMHRIAGNCVCVVCVSVRACVRVEVCTSVLGIYV